MPQPQMHAIRSGHVMAVGYDDATSELHVHYAPSVKNPAGAKIVYDGVEPHVWDRLVEADSMGSALHTHVKKPGYAFRDYVPDDQQGS